MMCSVVGLISVKLQPVGVWNTRLPSVLTFTGLRQVLVILVQFMTFISTDTEIWT